MITCKDPCRVRHGPQGSGNDFSASPEAALALSPARALKAAQRWWPPPPPPAVRPPVALAVVTPPAVLPCSPAVVPPPVLANVKRRKHPLQQQQDQTPDQHVQQQQDEQLGDSDNSCDTWLGEAKEKEAAKKAEKKEAEDEEGEQGPPRRSGSRMRAVHAAVDNCMGSGKRDMSTVDQHMSSVKQKMRKMVKESVVGCVLQCLQPKDREGNREKEKEKTQEEEQTEKKECEEKKEWERKEECGESKEFEENQPEGSAREDQEEEHEEEEEEAEKKPSMWSWRSRPPPRGPGTSRSTPLPKMTTSLAFPTSAQRPALRPPRVIPWAVPRASCTKPRLRPLQGLPPRWQRGCAARCQVGFGIHGGLPGRHT